jgi:hypothetical protein
LIHNKINISIICSTAAIVITLDKLFRLSGGCANTKNILQNILFGSFQSSMFVSLNFKNNQMQTFVLTYRQCFCLKCLMFMLSWFDMLNCRQCFCLKCLMFMSTMVSHVKRSVSKIATCYYSSENLALKLFAVATTRSNSRRTGRVKFLFIFLKFIVKCLLRSLTWQRVK